MRSPLPMLTLVVPLSRASPVRASTVLAGAVLAGAVLAGAVLAGAVLAGAARADCGAEESPSVGVTLRRCDGEGRRWAEARIDLAAADVGVRASRPEERGGTVEAWAESVDGTALALPGGPFHFPSFEPAGLTVGDGARWSGTRDGPELAVLAFDAHSAALLVPAEQVVPFEPWMREVVSGVEVLRDGAARECHADGCEPAPRTGVGISADGRTLVVIAVQGWSAESAGVGDRHLGELLYGAGAFQGLRTGDGAASALWVRGHGAVVTPSDGALRAGAAHLGIVDRSRGAGGRLVGVLARAGDTEPLTEARVRVETTDGRRVAESGTLTPNAYFELTLPARDYVVRGSLAGYRTSCRICRVEPGRETWCSQFLEPGAGEERCQPPPRGIDAGPWPEGDAGARGDGSVEPARSSSCACSAAPSSPPLRLLILLAVLGLTLAHRAGRRSSSRRSSGRTS